MSPNNPGNFVNDLVEMAKAFEALPKALADLEDANNKVEDLHDVIQRLELKLVDRNSEIESLNSRIRTLEVDRDHAETMFLEADDRTSRALDFIKATFGNAGSLIQALEPAKAVEPMIEPTTSAAFWPSSGSTEVHSPEAEPEGLHTTPSSGQSESPLPVATEASSQNAASTTEAPAAPSTSTNPAPEVAQPHPTASSTEEPYAQSVSSTDTATPSPSGRYSGKLYSEVSGNGQWPSKDEWLSEGGTLDNFFA